MKAGSGGKGTLARALLPLTHRALQLPGQPRGSQAIHLKINDPVDALLLTDLKGLLEDPRHRHTLGAGRLR